MSRFYYQQQRKEDVMSLQAMFGPPWTFELLGSVLDYYNGNVDEAISRLLILNEHHNGNPTPLVENLLLTGCTSLPQPPHMHLSDTKKHGKRHRKIVQPHGPPPPSSSIPKSMMKKPPPARKSQVHVVLADSFDSATVTIEKQTRRRIGIPMKLPEDFLRIPQVPLFAEDHLDHLMNMPSHAPLHDYSSSSEPTDASTLEDAAVSVPLQSTSEKFQALRASMHFPTFQRNCGSNAFPAEAAQIQNQNTLQNASYTNLLSKFAIPKITPSTTSLPKLTPMGGRADASDDATASSDSEKYRTTNAPGRWSLASTMGTASSMMKKVAPQHDNKNLNSVNTTLSQSSTDDEEAEPGVRGWSLPQISSSLKAPLALANLRVGGSSVHANHDTLSPQEQPLSTEKIGQKLSTGMAAFGSSIKLNMNLAKQQPTKSEQESTTFGIDTIDTYAVISQLERRSITLRQFKSIVKEAQYLCDVEKWKHSDTGFALRPHQITMYDLMRYYVLPRTQTHSCSYVEAALGQNHQTEGSNLPRPPQWFVSHSWSDSICHLADCLEQHASDRNLDPDSAMYWICALAMNQHSKKGASIAISTIDESSLQNPLVTWKAMNATEGVISVIDKNCKYYTRVWCLWELFLALERSRSSSSGDGNHHLIDIYAVNKDGCAVGLTAGPVEVDKYRHSKDTSKSSEKRTMHYDGKDSLIFHKHPCNKLEWSELRAVRQCHFDFPVLFPALDIHMESSNASMEEDARRIMNCIVQYNTDGNIIDNVRIHEAEALTSHSGYSYVNALLKGFVAGKVYRSALESAARKPSGEAEKEQLKKVQAALSASPIEFLCVSFSGCKAFKIRDALQFFESLPSSLRHLDLDYSFLEFRYGEEFAIGFERLGENLEVFKLNIAYCANLENLDRLWEELGKLINLRHLVVVIHPNKSLTSIDGLTEALGKMPVLEHLELEFDCYGEYSKLVAMAKGETQLSNLSSTCRNVLGKTPDSARQARELHQEFDKASKLAHLDIAGAYISDSSIQKLCRALISRKHETKPKSLKLRFMGGLGKKLRSVETIDDLEQALHRIRNGLKLFS